MKKVLFSLLTLGLTSGIAYADDIHSFQEAVKVLTRGKDLTFVVNFDKCNIVNNHGGKLTGISMIRTPMITVVRNNQISARAIIPTGDVPEIPELGNVYQTSTWTFDAGNHFNAVLRVLDPVTYVDKIPPTQITCDLGVGVSVFS